MHPNCRCDGLNRSSKMVNEKASVDVLIGGAGFAGLALAIALCQSLGDSFVVTVADPTLNQTKIDARASAIAAAARRLFETIGVWNSVAQDAQPILDMVITDSRLDDAIRPTFLSFEGEIAPGEPFAHMIENGPLVDALVVKARDEGVTLSPTAVTEFASSPSAQGEAQSVEVYLADGSNISTKLLVAADGARSRIREQAGIATF